MAKQSNIVSFEDARRAARGTGAVDRASLSPRESAALLFEDPEEDIQEEAPQGPLARFVDKRAQSKRRRGKAKAERAYARTYGGASDADAVAAAADAGPRAAVYKGQMGAKQRRASRIQERASGIGAGAMHGVVSFDWRRLSRRATRVIGTLTVLVVLAVSLYAPAQQYYQQMRERDRLNAEYAAIQERNDSLQDSVETLQTDAGVEDRALSEFGMVKEGDAAGSVIGANLDDTSSFTAKIVPGSVPAPETWYSGVLDVLFRYPG